MPIKMFFSKLSGKGGNGSVSLFSAEEACLRYLIASNFVSAYSLLILGLRYVHPKSIHPFAHEISHFKGLFGGVGIEGHNICFF